MFYYLYQVKNNLNGKIYVGVHKTSNMNDGYMGSGKVIIRAIKKHGIDNFTKVILETFENAEAMYAREKQVVTEQFLSQSNVYNLRQGGFGGFDHINKKVANGTLKRDTRIGGLARSAKYKSDPLLREHIKRVKSADWYRQKENGKLVNPPKIRTSCIKCKCEMTTCNLNRHYITHQ